MQKDRSLGVGRDIIVVADCRAVNNALLDTYQLKSLDGVLEVDVEKLKIRRLNGKLYVFYDQPTLSDADTNVSLTTADTDNFAMREPYDRVIRCLGFKFNESLFSQ